MVESGIYLISEEGKIYGKANVERLDKLVWYKKLWTKISKKYRLKFIDIEPFKL